MKFLIDNQLPIALSNFLSSRGFDAKHVLDLEMNRSSDIEISKFALQDARIIVTKDEDFSVLVALGVCSAQVIWIRFGNCRTKTLLGAFSESLDLLLERLETGEKVIQLLGPI
jgi:predicted nuclease of predicted toxin-antitoxin system